MAEKIIISIITLLIILCIFAYFVDVLTVISKNMEFHDICRGYMHIAEQNSGLSYDNVVISAPASAMYGSMFNLDIQASYEVNMITDVFTWNSQEYVMHFSQNITARRIY